MAADFADAFKRGCAASPEQEDNQAHFALVKRLCSEVSALIAPAQLHWEEIPGTRTSVVRVVRQHFARGDVGEPPELFGVEIVGLHLGAPNLGMGPQECRCRLSWCDGREVTCYDSQMLEAELAAGLRRPGVAQRIRMASRDVQQRVRAGEGAA